MTLYLNHNFIIKKNKDISSFYFFCENSDDIKKELLIEADSSIISSFDIVYDSIHQNKLNSSFNEHFTCSFSNKTLNQLSKSLNSTKNEITESLIAENATLIEGLFLLFCYKENINKKHLLTLNFIQKKESKVISNIEVQITSAKEITNIINFFDLKIKKLKISSNYTKNDDKDLEYYKTLENF